MKDDMADEKASEPRLVDAESVRSTWVAETAGVVDGTAEAKLCRKLDLRLLPVLAVMYLFNALDKSNLGNAQTAGLSTDLGFTGNQYNQMVSIFFVPYVLFAPGLAVVGKRFGPARVLPIMMFAFGSMTLLGAAARNFSAMFALRWFLGTAEAAFFPLVIYYLTTFYRRGELARRLAVFYAASNVAGAFGGLLAFGVFQLRGGRLQAWRYLFLLEGSLSVVFSFFAFWWLPRTAASARFLDEHERALALHRIQLDSSAVVGETFSLREALRVFGQPTTYAFLLLEACVGVPLQSVSLFLPQLVQALGHDSVTTNLYTVAPSLTGAAVLLALAFASDLTRLRAPFMVLGFAFTVVGFVVFAASGGEDYARVAYLATFLMCSGTSAPSVILSTWYSNNVAHESRRLLLTSVAVPLANVMGLVSGNVFRQADAPKYLPALAVTASFGAVGALAAAGLGVYMALDNNRRNARAGRRVHARDVPTRLLGDGPDGSEFRWFL